MMRILWISFGKGKIEPERRAETENGMKCIIK